MIKMDQEHPELAIARIPLTVSVTSDELRALLEVIETYYSAYLWLEAAEGIDNSDTGIDLYRSTAQILQVEFLTIGTPNELQLKGTIAQMAAVVALLAGIIALPKIPLEREQLRVAIAKTEVELRLVEIQTLSAELELIERAKRLHAEGRISESDLAQQLERLKRIRPSLRYAAGVLRDAPTLDSPERLQAQRLQVKILERAKFLGASNPSINLFLGVFSGDISVVQSSLHAGADVNATFSDVITSLPSNVTHDEEFRKIFTDLVKLKFL